MSGSGDEINECLNRGIGVVVSRFDLGGKGGGPGVAMVKQRVGQGPADALVEQDEHRGDLGSFLGEPVTVAAAFPLEVDRELAAKVVYKGQEAANLAEGCGRNGDAELARFCSSAMGSASELDYHLLLASDLKLIHATDYTDLAQQTSEVKRMPTGLLQKLTADR